MGTHVLRYDKSGDPSVIMDPIAMAAVMVEPGIARIVHRFTIALDQRLRDDRLPGEAVDLVVAAVDEASMQLLWWTDAPAARQPALGRQLLALTGMGAGCRRRSDVAVK